MGFTGRIGTHRSSWAENRQTCQTRHYINTCPIGYTGCPVVIMDRYTIVELPVVAMLLLTP